MKTPRQCLFVIEWKHTEAGSGSKPVGIVALRSFNTGNFEPLVFPVYNDVLLGFSSVTMEWYNMFLRELVPLFSTKLCYTILRIQYTQYYVYSINYIIIITNLS